MWKNDGKFNKIVVATAVMTADERRKLVEAPLPQIRVMPKHTHSGTLSYKARSLEQLDGEYYS